MSRFQTFTPRADDRRPEIVDLVELIIGRIVNGHKTTSAIMPPRFGKSDVIRLLALEARSALSAVTVAMAPWVFLRNQLIDPDKLKRMSDDLKIGQFNGDVLLSGAFDARFFMQSPERDLWSITISAACQESSLIQMESAVKCAVEDFRWPFIVIVDECHLVAEGPDGWGRVTRRLLSAGAHVVLLTGTPYRSDNLAPFGFNVRELEHSVVEFKTPTFNDAGAPVFKLYSAERTKYELIADKEVTRSEAWQRGALTPIQARWFGFFGNGEDIAAVESRADARKMRAAALRDLDVIQQAVEILVDDVMLRRHTAPTSAAMVCVGNDAADETRDSSHTTRVHTIVRQVWKQRTGLEPEVTIAMLKDSDSQDASKKIKRFVGTEQQPGIGDVIIVKQMGVVGLDVPRLKTLLDLSTTRTLAATIQKWLRIATVWTKPDDRKQWVTRNATLILPSDQETQGIYSYIVTEEGGEFSALQNKILKNEIEREPGEEGDVADMSISDPHADGATDLKLNRIDADEDTLVDTLLHQQPKLAGVYDRIEISQLLAAGQFVITPDFGGSGDPQPPSVNVPDLGLAVDQLKETIREKVKDIANQRYDYVQHREAWVRENRIIWNQAKQYAGISGELKACRDLPKLTRAVDYVNTLLRGAAA